MIETKERGLRVGAKNEAGLWGKVRHSLRWLPSCLWRQFLKRPEYSGSVHLIIALADHFEPAILPDAEGARASRAEQERRLERWCREYPKLVQDWRDADGRVFAHTYFYPAEQYDRNLIERLAEHCRAGFGEVEIHLHHGINTPDTPESTRGQLVEFRDALARHGCLSRMGGQGQARYAFVHGNWALANSAGGLWCGVDNEMEILAETGCYADFTLPAAPDSAQVAKTNALYECAAPLGCRAPHRRGRDLKAGRAPEVFPLIIQGPLLLDFDRKGRRRFFPRIENGELTGTHPPTIERLKLWRRATITVQGRPDWLFIKLHCHGMDSRDNGALLGEPMRQFLRELVEEARSGRRYALHFVTAREMVNIIFAACDGRNGSPGNYRDYRLRLAKPAAQSESGSNLQTLDLGRKG